jgi:hypothetical protein
MLERDRFANSSWADMGLRANLHWYSQGSGRFRVSGFGLLSDFGFRVSDFSGHTLAH